MTLAQITLVQMTLPPGMEGEVMDSRLTRCICKLTKRKTLQKIMKEK